MAMNESRALPQEAPARPLPDIRAELTLAAQQHRQGRLADAESAYLRVLAAAPDHAEAQHNLGLLALQRNRAEEALERIGRAIELDPERADFRSNLGGVLRKAGHLRDAAEAYCQALERKPDFAEAHNNLGVVLRDLGRPDDAIAAYDRALRLKPDYAEAHYNRGNALKQLGRLEEALEAYRRAAALRADYAKAHNNMGNALKALGRNEEALEAFRQAIALRPRQPESHANLGLALHALGRLQEAEQAFRQAAALRPAFVEAHQGLAIVLAEQGRTEDATAAFRQTLSLRPGVADAQAYLGMIALRQGGGASGAAGAIGLRPFAQPQWTGGRVDGSLLLWGEQGVGDELLYAGLVQEAAARAQGCVLECDARLVRLFTRSFPGVTVLARSDPPDPRTRERRIAAQSGVGGLPRLLRRSFADFPGRTAYLRADPGRTQELRARYRALGSGPVVGIAWRSRNPTIGAVRTTALADWAPILRVPGSTFVSLQYGDCAEELAAVRARLGAAVHRDAEIDALADLDAFAAQVAAMDLVISIGNTTVHMAGALGRPVWTLLPAGQGLLWYWFLDRADSPWYPTMRLFRQPSPGDWAPAIGQVAIALQDWRPGSSR